MNFVLRMVLALWMVGAGTMHFLRPNRFVRVVPEFLPAPMALVLVLVSGVFEILGGVGLLFSASRRWAAWGLIALFVAVFPANVNMAANRIGFGRQVYPAWVLWVRLPLQALLIAWAHRYTRRDQSPRHRKLDR